MTVVKQSKSEIKSFQFLIVLFFSCLTLCVAASSGFAWERAIHLDRMSQTEQIWYSIDSKGSSHCSSGTSQARLVLTCHLDKPRIILGTKNCFFVDERLAEYRTESSGKQTAWLTPQEAGSAAHLGGIVDKSDASILFSHMISAKYLLLRIYPFGVSTVDFEFDIEGLQEVIGNDFVPCLD